MARYGRTLIVLVMRRPCSKSRR